MRPFAASVTEGRLIRVLVTGAAGFIGSSLVETLAARGDDVLALDALTDYYPVALKLDNVEQIAGPRVDFRRGDLNHLDFAELFDRPVDAVVHLAGQPGVRKSWGSDFDAYTRDNVNATQRVLEATLSHAPEARFVYASSSSVYGEAERYPTTEDMLPRPHSPYGVTKLAGEHLAGLYGENFGLDTVAFRFFTVYGPRQRPDMAFTRFLRAAHEGLPITVYGTGEQIRDFTFVGDIVDALIRAVDAPRGGRLPRVMNLSGGSSVSVNDVLRTIESVTGRTLQVDRRDAVRGDVFRTGGDSSLARESLGWVPQTSLEDGLRRQFQWVGQTSSLG